MSANLALLFKDRFNPPLPDNVVQIAIANAQRLVEQYVPERVTIQAHTGPNELWPPAAQPGDETWTLPEYATLTDNGRVLTMVRAMPVTYTTPFTEEMRTTAILKLAQQDLVYTGYLNASVGGLSGAVDQTNKILWDLREDTL